MVRSVLGAFSGLVVSLSKVHTRGISHEFHTIVCYAVRPEQVRKRLTRFYFRSIKRLYCLLYREISWLGKLYAIRNFYQKNAAIIGVEGEGDGDEGLALAPPSPT